MMSSKAGLFSSSSSPSPPISLCNESPDTPACLFPHEDDNYSDIPDCFLPPLEDTSMDIPACFLAVEDDETTLISPSKDIICHGNKELLVPYSLVHICNPKMKRGIKSSYMSGEVIGSASHAPPPATVPGGGSLLEGIGSTIAQGMTFGTGSAVAHRAVDSILGPRTVQHETGSSQAPDAASLPTRNAGTTDACNMHSMAFQEESFLLFPF
ncbi:hypothetical protein KSP39_PZI012622 [Platanthera zijinensis]|uniref:Uncharacterized protein n=1 Tax=Platanthera zijinensis TaxID=2320716 RepID=A0AAP0BE17_9ASPA